MKKSADSAKRSPAPKVAAKTPEVASPVDVEELRRALTGEEVSPVGGASPATSVEPPAPPVVLLEAKHAKKKPAAAPARGAAPARSNGPLKAKRTGPVAPTELRTSTVRPTGPLTRDEQPKRPPRLKLDEARSLPMQPVGNEHYRSLRALADELDAYLTAVEQDGGWWREPRFVVMSHGEAVGVVLQPRPKRDAGASRK